MRRGERSRSLPAARRWGAGLRGASPVLGAQEHDVRRSSPTLRPADWRESSKQTNKQTSKPLLILLRNFPYFRSSKIPFSHEIFP